MNATIELAQQLISKVSVTPEDAGCQDLIAKRLIKFGFDEERFNFFDTQNIWLRRGKIKPLFVFLGHTDVVPSGNICEWNSPPFEPSIRNGFLYGRGAADMKGGIASFITACESFIRKHPNHLGSIAVMLTSDEEGNATNGVVKVIDALESRQEKIDFCLVGEPSSDKKIGDTIRVGRRGSLCAKLTIHGIQGHIAYPEKAKNPIHLFASALVDLTQENWDEASEFFPKTSLQISSINSGAVAENIIPSSVEVMFNLRFGVGLDVAAIKRRISVILDRYSFDYKLDFRLSGKPFLTSKGTLIKAAHRAVKVITGYDTHNDTSGGTSDGRFIAPTGATVIELGHINESIHKINECVNIQDLVILSEIYEKILEALLHH